MTAALTVFQARAGDHNDLAIPGAMSLSKLLAQRLGLEPTVIGRPEPMTRAGWKPELEFAMPALEAMRDRFEAVYLRGQRSLAASSRCAVSLATLPVVARHRPDAVVVWFDAHGDLNTPDASATGYLGGLALTGPLGMWESGLGSGLRFENLVLVGQRDLDPFEVELIEERDLPMIAPGSNLAQRLSTAVGGRPVYVHLDCDVLEPGIVPTDYRCEGGLSLTDLKAACAVLAESEVVGLEIAEYQISWVEGGEPVSAAPLIDAVSPLLARL